MNDEIPTSYSSKNLIKSISKVSIHFSAITKIAQSTLDGFFRFLYPFFAQFARGVINTGCIDENNRTNTKISTDLLTDRIVVPGLSINNGNIPSGQQIDQ